MAGSSIDKGGHVLLYLDRRRKWLVRAEEGRKFETHRGVIDLGGLVGRAYGEFVESSLGDKIWLLRPTTYDYIMKATRPTQILYPKDIGLVILRLGLTSGLRVLEVGLGSGALAIALASAIRPDGKVTSYEVREEFVSVARRNLERAELADFVEIKNRDAREGIDERYVDAAVLDVGEPWSLMPPVREALAPGCPLATFSPTINQVEKSVAALRDLNFVDLETTECLVREIRVQAGMTRPEMRMIGHTGYLTFARKTS